MPEEKMIEEEKREEVKIFEKGKREAFLFFYHQVIPSLTFPFLSRSRTMGKIHHQPG